MIGTSDKGISAGGAASQETGEAFMDTYTLPQTVPFCAAFTPATGIASDGLPPPRLCK